MKNDFIENRQFLFEEYKDHAGETGFFNNLESMADFMDAYEKYRKSVLISFAESGVSFISFDGVVISPFAKIGKGTLIYPCVQIKKNVTVGENCVLTSGTVIENSSVGNGCVINSTQIYDSVLDDNVKIGPFCHVRPNTHLCSGVKVGDFVEIKNSTVGEDTHASHLTYIGDSDVGKRVNFGCGVVTCNFDGGHKYRTTIGDDAFIGCNTNLIAPVTLENNSYTAAGSTITSDVPEDSLGIARAKQVNYEKWVIRRKIKDKS